ncbi:MAG: hypothetical protein M0031_03055 [Thermaerobacter sp.]|nr:hypothetical protein [Thermaerobacter sp.]
MAAVLASVIGCAGPSPASRQRTAVSTNWLLSGYHVGVNVGVMSLLPGSARSPSGVALVQLLRRQGIPLVRLMPPGEARPGQSQAGAFRSLADGGLKAVFAELGSAHIHAILTLDGYHYPDGRPNHSAWGWRRGQGSYIRSAAAFTADEDATLAEIRRQEGGRLPPQVVAIDVVNEPLVDPVNLRRLAQVVAALRGASGLPVTIGGWHQAASTPGGALRFSRPQATAQVAPMEDFVSVHLYPDGLTRLSKETAHPGPYLPAVRAYLRTVLAQARGKLVFVEEFGGLNGLAPARAGGPTLGSAAHQRAVIDAVLQEMWALRSRGVIGGTAWVLVPVRPGVACDPWSLICYSPSVTLPALADLGAHHASTDGG